LFKLFGRSIYPDPVTKNLAESLSSVRSGGFVADVGGGTGVLSGLVRDTRQDLCFVLLDPSAGMLRHGAEHALRIKGVAEALPFMDRSLGAILVGDAIHHFRDPDKAITEIGRTLKHDGLLFIFDIDPATTMGRIIKVGERLLGEPARFFPPELLSGVLERNGFQVEIKKYGWRYTLKAHRQSG
jgi:ubiquinone/menaquinone biosynthesis C-methylase UbiE